MPSNKMIVDLENRFWTAIRDEDVDTATSLMAKTSILAGSQGVMAVTKQDYARMAGDSSWKLHDFKLDKVDVRFSGEDTAVIGYVVTEDMTVDGRKQKIVAADTSTWVRQNSEWLCISHTESVLGDPFGRDKTASGQAA